MKNGSFKSEENWCIYVPGIILWVLESNVIDIYKPIGIYIKK